MNEKTLAENKEVLENKEAVEKKEIDYAALQADLEALKPRKSIVKPMEDKLRQNKPNVMMTKRKRTRTKKKHEL